MTFRVFLDIETIPCQDRDSYQDIAEEIPVPANMSRPETIAAWRADRLPALAEEQWRQTAFDGSRGHVAVICWAVGDSDHGITDDGVRVDAIRWEGMFRHRETLHAEMDMLTAFYARLSDARAAHVAETGDRTVQVVGHNVIAFDLRMLFQRSVVLRARPPAFLPFDARPWDQSVYDVMLKWTCDHRGKISADRLSRALGGNGKVSMTGADVWPAIRDGRLADVIDYCRQDVYDTVYHWRRLVFAPGA